MLDRRRISYKEVIRMMHNFIDDDYGQVKVEGLLSSGDVCIYCGLVVDGKIEKLFTKMLSRHTIDSDIEEYESDLAFCYNIVNKKHPCLTDEEYAIKKLLE